MCSTFHYYRVSKDENALLSLEKGNILFLIYFPICSMTVEEGKDIIGWYVLLATVPD